MICVCRPCKLPVVHTNPTSSKLPTSNFFEIFERLNRGLLVQINAIGPGVNPSPNTNNTLVPPSGDAGKGGVEDVQQKLQALLVDPVICETIRREQIDIEAIQMLTREALQQMGLPLGPCVNWKYSRKRSIYRSLLLSPLPCFLTDPRRLLYREISLIPLVPVLIRATENPSVHQKNTLAIQ